MPAPPAGSQSRTQTDAGRWRSSRRAVAAAAVGGFVAGLAAIAAGGVTVVAGGLFDATAVKPHYPPVGWVTHEAMIRSVAARAPLAVLPGDARRGFRLYEAHCVMCHGGPGVARQAWVNGMTPDPPYLLDAARRWSPGELTHIVAKGVKMTGMPAWGPSMSPRDVADTVAFLEALPGVTARDYARLKSEDSPTARLAQLSPGTGPRP